MIATFLNINIYIYRNNNSNLSQAVSISHVVRQNVLCAESSNLLVQFLCECVCICAYFFASISSLPASRALLEGAFSGCPCQHLMGQLKRVRKSVVNNCDQMNIFIERVLAGRARMFFEREERQLYRPRSPLQVRVLICSFSHFFYIAAQIRTETPAGAGMMKIRF